MGLFHDEERRSGEYGYVGDILDLLNCYGPPSASEAQRWHSKGHKIFCYANPQAGLEVPETYRRNYGLLLWQAGYDGAMNFAYQAGARGNIWNDWAMPLSNRFRKRAMAYPTVGRPIDTLQWEGWREGVDDVRYLSTLLDIMDKVSQEEGVASPALKAAQDFLLYLRGADLGKLDMDSVRDEIVSHILSLLEEGASG